MQCESYTLKLTSTAPAIDGVNVTFIADVYTSNGHVPHFTDKLDWVRSNHSHIIKFDCLYCFGENGSEFQNFYQQNIHEMTSNCSFVMIRAL